MILVKTHQNPTAIRSPYCPWATVFQLWTSLILLKLTCFYYSPGSAERRTKSEMRADGAIFFLPLISIIIILLIPSFKSLLR